VILREISLAGAFVIEPEPRADERGFFARTYGETEFRELGLEPCGRQWSVSYNIRRGTLRGLHYQADPHAETKLVRCVAGAVWDVIVDLRRSSATFGRWAAVELTAANRCAFYIPRGFAHGFQTLSDDAELLYAISPDYVVEAARGIRWNDPTIAITWPLPPVSLSPRDADLPLLEAAA
jgi:dTDP-4-dehydrorhamnose 3,5-epimerase